jgi:hypothetical protein
LRTIASWSAWCSAARRRGRPLSRSRGAVDGQRDAALSVGENELDHAAERQRRADRAGVIEDRRADRADAGRDVLVGDRIAALAREAQLIEQRLARRRRLGGERLGLPLLEVLVPEGLRLEREQCAHDSAGVERQRAAQSEREQVDSPPVDPLDADGLVAAADAEEDGLADLLVDALHHRERSLAPRTPSAPRKPFP